jgi:voltage-gated potassium channel
VPITGLGKFWAMLTMLCGLCVLALPVAIISSGFAQEVGRRDFVITWSMMSRIPMLADLDPGQVAEILPLLHAQNLPPNVEVIAEGEAGVAMYFVASGGVHLAAPGGDVDYKTGSFFGVVAMVGDTESIGRYVTTTRCRLLKLYREDFLRIERANPDVGGIIRRAAEERLVARRTMLEQAATSKSS